MARADLEALEPRREELEQQLKIQLLPKDAADERSAILEVRAGTGGDEAALFAADLFRMYSRYAELRGWKVEIISISENDLGGYKEIVASITRRRRVRAAEVRIRRASRAAHSGDGDGRAHPHVGGDRRRAARGRGGRHRHPAGGHPHRHDARRRRRRPARQQDGLGRAHDASADRHHRRLGREVAAPEPAARHAGAALAASTRWSASGPTARAPQARKGQVGSGDRSQRIRTYNFPQGRVTDHRINLTLHKLDEVLEGGGARRDHRRADHRAPGEPARGHGRQCAPEDPDDAGGSGARRAAGA